MELYGSLLNISGSVTASTFTGSFIGDGSGLVGIQASGVEGLNLSQIATGSVTASLSPDGFNVNTDTSITGSLRVSGNITAEQYNVTIISSSVLFQSGSSKLGDTLDDIHQLTGSVEITGSISLNGEPIGTGKLNETTFQTYTSSNDDRVAALEIASGSLNSFTSSINTTIKSKLDNDGVISSSIQVNIADITGYSSFSSSIALTDLNQNNSLTSIENKTGSYATTGSNLFIGTQTHSGSIIPSVDNTYDLGSVEYQWRDVYISSGSLYIDGTKVLSSTAQELVITTDNGQSIKILEGTTDSIILQTADGNIELKSSADGDILLDPTNGKILLKGPVEILSGQKIQSSVGGTPVVFANDVVISGSIDITGTIEGIDLTAFSSSINTRLSGLESSAVSLNSYTSSNTTNINAIHTATSSLNSFTSSINTTIKSKLDNDGVISGSIQVDITGTTGYSTFSSSIASTTLEQSNRITVLDLKTGSYATTGSNIFQGNQTITGSLYVSQDLIIAGSSSIQHISSSVVNIADNIITVNAQNPSVRFGGLAVVDSGSFPQVSGSILFDSTNDQWVFVHQNQLNITSSILLMGPQTINNLGNESYPTTNRILKSVNAEHVGDSNITDSGDAVSINSNTIITGSLLVTNTIVSQTTPLVSGSSQISFNGITDKPTLVSGSSQVLNGSGVWSGSAQLPSGIVSGSSQISFSGIADKPTLVSGSSQITYGSLSGIPGGIVSGSAQVDLTSTTNYPTGIKTRLNAEGVISGSSQVTSIGNSQLTNSSFHVGTTSISLGRASAAQTLTGVSIDGNSATASSVNFANITAGTRTNYTLDFKPPSSGNYAGFSFSKSTSVDGASDAGYLLIRGGTDSDIYTAEGVTLVADAGWLTLAQRTTASKGIRLMTGTSTASTRVQILTDGTIKLSSLTSNGFVKTSGSDGTLSIDTTAYFSTSSQVTLSSTTGFGTYLNQAVLTSSTPTFAGVKSSTNFQALSGGGYSIRNAADNGNVGGFSRRGAWEGNSNYDPAIWAETGYGLYFYTNGSATIKTIITPNGSLLHGHTAVPSESAWLGTAVIGKDTYNKVIIGSLNSTTTGAYIGGHNSALTAWADINVAGENIIFRYQQTERARFDTSGHFVPGANNSYNLGSASLGWANVYTNDLHLSNMNKPEGNDIDGTNGTWTIQEGEENLYIINNRNNKKFKISLEEIL